MKVESYYSSCKPLARRRGSAFFVRQHSRIVQTPRIRIVFLMLILCGAFVVVMAYAPRYLKLHRERQEVLSRIQAVGGWGALRQICESFAGNRQADYGWQAPGTGTFVYVRGQTRATNTFHETVPPQLAALNPQTIYYHAPEGFIKPQGFSEMRVVQIGFFGTRRAFAEDLMFPFYGIEVACGTNAGDYVPQYRSFDLRTHWNVLDRYSHYRKVAEGVYEVY